MTTTALGHPSTAAEAEPTSPRRRRPSGIVATWGLPLLLLATAALYLWDLDVSGPANAYYTAAADAGSQSWKAFFFGSLDASNASTVDKPALFLWPMDLSVRLFGLSSWSVLVPQALEGVASVWLLHQCVRRATGSRTPALLAGALFAATPVCTLMYRYDNPDAMLTMLLIAAALASQRAVQSEVAARALRWLLLAGLLVGLAFLTKMLVALLVLPALALVYLLHAHPPWPRRVGHLLAAGVAVVVGGGWWVAIVELWPASQRPYISGSTTNSVLELALGYNGIQRITGSGTITLARSGIAATNLGRIARTNIGAEIVWLLPAAIILGVTGHLIARRLHDRALRSSFVLWSTWLGVYLVTFAAMAGIFHSYYTILLAPAVAALVATGGWLAWGARGRLGPRRALTAAGVVTSVVSATVLLLYRAPTTWLAVPLLGLGVLLVERHHRDRLRATAAALVAVAITGPLTFSVSTALQAHTGSGPMSGPGQGSASTALTVPGTPAAAHSFLSAVLVPRAVARPVSPELTALLRSLDDGYRWVAATGGALTSAAYELSTGRPVLAIGGYKGADPTPTLAAFQHLVARGDVPLYFVGGTPGAAALAIRTWVEASYPQIDVAGEIVYDLRATPPYR